MNHVAPGRIEPIIERLHTLHPRLIDLSLERLQRLLADLGHPERQLPPIVHVAGTNGKGSVCAFIRAMAEAAGLRAHVYTSPHLVRFNERFRIAGRLVDDDALADAFEVAERVNGGAPITVFEVITAVAFMLFAAAPADVCVLEVGLGGRGDATNVIEAPAASAITSVSLDHAELLGDTLAAIAAEKAGIMRAGVPVVVGAQPREAMQALRAAAARTGARLLARGEAWEVERTAGGLRFSDEAGRIDAPAPGLPGLHQFDNAGVAIATLRAAMRVPPAAYAGLAAAEWPARLQRLHGRLAAMAPQGWEVWLDGGHNPGAAEALAAHARQSWGDRPLHLIVGMKQSKDALAFLSALTPPAASVWAVQEPGQHLALPVDDIIAASGGQARRGGTVEGAMSQIAGAPGRRADAAPGARILICGSLYLAGEVLKADGPKQE